MAADFRHFEGISRAAAYHPDCSVVCRLEPTYSKQPQFTEGSKVQKQQTWPVMSCDAPDSSATTSISVCKQQQHLCVVSSYRKQHHLMVQLKEDYPLRRP